MSHLAVLAALLLAVASLFAVRAPAAAQTATPSVGRRAGLVVRFPDGRVETRCVAFAEPAITGEELLARSGFKAIINPTGALGGAVCGIDGSGCRYPSQDCFCKCVGVQCEYWAYYHWAGGASPGAATGAAWQYSQIGASAYQVTDGVIEGWSWGPGNFSSATEPPKIAFADICPVGAGTVPAAAALAGPANVAQYASFALLAGLLLVMALLVLRRRLTYKSVHEGARRLTNDRRDHGALEVYDPMPGLRIYFVCCRESSCAFVDTVGQSWNRCILLRG